MGNEVTELLSAVRSTAAALLTLPPDELEARGRGTVGVAAAVAPGDASFGLVFPDSLSDKSFLTA